MFKTELKKLPIYNSIIEYMIKSKFNGWYHKYRIYIYIVKIKILKNIYKKIKIIIFIIHFNTTTLKSRIKINLLKFKIL